MVAADQRTGQLAFAYRSSKRGDGLLLQAAGLAGSLNMQLAVVVPFVLPADGPGCCGIRGRRWEDILRQVAEEDAERARRLLDDAGVPHSVTLAEGPSVPDIVEAFACEGSRASLEITSGVSQRRVPLSSAQFDARLMNACCHAAGLLALDGEERDALYPVGRTGLACAFGDELVGVVPELLDA